MRSASRKRPPASATAGSARSELVGDCLKRIDEVDGEIEAWAFLDRDHAMRQAEAADDHRKQGKPIGPAAWRAGRHQGHLRHRRHADGVRIEAVGRAHAAPRCGGCGAAAGGRRRDPRQDGDDRVRLLQSGQDPKSAQPGSHAGRIVLGLGRGRCGADGAGRHRLADQRLGDPPRRLLRRGRLQADTWPDSAERRAAAVAGARSCRRVCALGRRCGAARRDACGLRRRRSGYASPRPSALRRCGGKRAAVAAALCFRPLVLPGSMPRR